jgi:hypothetical protein
MKRLLFFVTWLSLMLPAGADVMVNDLVTKMYGKRTRVELQLSNPGYSDQQGPVLVKLQARESEDKPWEDLHRWKLDRLPPGPHTVMVFHSDQLYKLSRSKTFQAQVRIEAPALETIEKLGRREKPED